jgi:hypothetical protein
MNLEPVTCNPVCELLKRLYEVRLMISQHETTRPDAVEWLETLGLVNGSAVGPRVHGSYRPEATCPLTGLPIIGPCSRTDCRYYVSYQWSQNCLSNYLCQTATSKTHTTLLKNEEIAFLYQLPLEQVGAIYDRAMQQLRSVTITRAQEEGELPEKSFSFLSTKEVCCVCESFVTRGLDDSYVTMTDGVTLAYCSQECRDEKPPPVISLEYRFGIEAESVVQWALHRFQTMSAFEHATGIPRTVLQQMCDRNDWDVTRYFPTLAKRRRHKILNQLRKAVEALDGQLGNIWQRYRDAGTLPLAQKILGRARQAT